MEGCLLSLCRGDKPKCVVSCNFVAAAAASFGQISMQIHVERSERAGRVRATLWAEITRETETSGKRWSHNSNNNNRQQATGADTKNQFTKRSLLSCTSLSLIL